MDYCKRCGWERDLEDGYCGECLSIVGAEQAVLNERAAWRETALDIIQDVAAENKVFTADEVKAKADEVGLGEPHHPNVWGGLFRIALNKGYMTKSGRTQRSQRANQHSTDIPIYHSKIYTPPTRVPMDDFDSFDAWYEAETA